MNVAEAFTFDCEEASLLGLIEQGSESVSRGVLIIVGGPQYRTGSHRQFTLLARHLAKQGFPTMRFDYRGMGDSAGVMRGFEAINEDLKAAVDTFAERCPNVAEVILWGLCDAASAACFYAHQDPRIRGVVLANPWVRTAGGEAKARLKHYYAARLFDPSLWGKILRGEYRVFESGRDFVKSLRLTLGHHAGDRGERQQGESPGSDAPLPERMAHGFGRFGGQVLVILSGNDLTASEFEDVVRASPQWRRLVRRPKVTLRKLGEADHTFSRRQWRDQVAEWTVDWLRSW